MGGEADQGSATIWTLGVALLFLAATYVVLVVCVAVGARHRAEAAADLAALAGAAAAQNGADGCASAATIAYANGASVTSCDLADDGTVTVRVRVVAPPSVARWKTSAVEATARAGS